ncbi:MAG: hypothetical protein ABW047_02740 [Nitrospiraceae bacterium]
MSRTVFWYVAMIVAASISNPNIRPTATQKNSGVGAAETGESVTRGKEQEA